MSTISCYVVEEHQEIIKPLFDLIKARNLSYEGLFMINLDSHSDLSVPIDMEVGEDGFLDQHEVLHKIDIESWVVPLFYMEIVKSVCWLHPDWTEHSFKSEQHFKVGKLKNENQLKVTCPSNSFISEGDYETADNLSQLKEVSLHVHSLSSQHTHSPCISQLNHKLRHTITQHSGFILSIDLDFFSTHDPFLSSFSPRQYYLLNQIYHFVIPDSSQMHSICSCVEARRNQLKILKEFFYSVHQDPDHIDYSNVGVQVRELVESLMESNGVGYDWEWLHEIGRGIDDCPLPHHPSNLSQINTLILNVKSLLATLPPPNAIFVCRSSIDDFCPLNQVEQIQELLLNSLGQLYSEVSIIKLYNK